MPVAVDGREVRIGVDTGGTFTDVVLDGPSGRCVTKVPSTPEDPALAVLEGIRQVLVLAGEAAFAQVIHGSTVATNALLERKGARTAFVTNEGLEGILPIGRQARPDLYDLEPRRSPPLVAAEDGRGVRVRMGADGAIVEDLDASDLRRWARFARSAGVEAAAVCLLHSYRDPRHEELVAEILEAEGISTTVSADLVGEYREYERALTAVANAYVAPLMRGYLRRLEGGVPRLRVQSSSPGTISAELAAREPVRTLLSGPAGGVLGARQAAPGVRRRDFVSFDMGGTSTDVAVCSRDDPKVSHLEIAGMELRMPSMDIHTVGAGGGSIATVDAGGALRVGPTSAGADPGPACYGRGGRRPTVTDANLVLGHLDPKSFLGGGMELDTEASRRALGELGEALGCDAETAARGVLDVATAVMARAVRQVTVARGLDPRRHDLVAFGGAGPMHGAALAERLGIDRVLVPRDPGALSAVGMLRAPAVRERSRSVLLPATVDGLREANEHIQSLGARVQGELATEGLDDIRVDLRADLRYVGQSHEIAVPWNDRSVTAFEADFRRRYGHVQGAPKGVEVVTVRATAWSPPKGSDVVPSVADASGSGPSRSVVFHSGGAGQRAGLYERSSLHCTIEGPALVVELSATTVIPAGWTATPVADGVLELRRAGGEC